MSNSFKGNRKNDRRYPGAKFPRPDNYKFRQEEAAERQAAYSKLSAKEKIALLDARLGKGIGAAKQRAKLASALEKAQARADVTTSKAKKSDQETTSKEKKGGKK